jgi:tetratricopeptide (TPR) repeat protein
VALLREGIAKVPVDKSLASLYQAAAEILDRGGKPDEAVALLRGGIAKIPTSQPLHQAAAEILDRRGKPDEAVALLREGIAKIPTSQPLHQAAAEILDRSGKPDEAVALLREGIVKVPAEKSLFSLYQSLGRILDRRGRTPEAIATLREGIRRIQVSGSGSRYRIVNMALYLAYAANDRGLLLEAPGWTGEECLDPQSKALSELLLAELLGNWAGAADRAARGRAEFPRFLDLAVREAFARLCAGAPDAAIAALGQFPNLRDTEAGNPLAPEQANRCIVPVTSDCETDAQAWERRIESILQDRAAAFRNTAAMAAALAERVSWAAAAERLLGMLRTVATSPKT